MQFLQWRDHTYGQTNEERGTYHSRQIYGVGARWKRKVDGRIDVGGENALELM
jgi:hypothetical protein